MLILGARLHEEVGRENTILGERGKWLRRSRHDFRGGKPAEKVYGAKDNSRK